MRLDTVAGHDVVALMNKISGLLVFVPSYKGIGHHEQEFTDERHLINGCEIISQLAWNLSTNPPEQIDRCDTN
jgi:acetylornithine deacetylase/succinyl-diaminopimelate desuccinylase-like protein